jgi:cell division topological specificity factor
MRSLFQRLSEALVSAPKSKDDAKQRLKFLLIHDQVDLTPAQLDQMKSEILEVITKYVEIDNGDDVEFKLNREEGCISLVSSVPVRRVHAARAI